MAVTPNNNTIEEVVVTATRQTSTVNKVALSVSAVTQKSLDQQGIQSVADLSSQVPGFTFRTSGGDNNPQLTLRGIGGNAIAGTSGSAPTTGVYLDDQPMQKRNANGLETGSGSPTPLLYDLERIEVLRGPQGTLYGGSSEGDTLRFITPTPSLTHYSGTARVGVSTMAGGGAGDEVGLALGGPIIQDKVGFRISGFRQHTPGWVDKFSEWDGHQFAKDVNWGTDYSLHGAMLWQVTPDLKATLSVFHQSQFSNDSSAVRSSSPAFYIPVTTFKNTGVVNGVRFSFPATTFGGYTIPAQTWLGDGNGQTNGRYLTPTNVQYVNSPRRSILTTPSLTLDYNWHDKLDFKSITSFVDDRTSGWTFTGGGAVRTTVLPRYNLPCPAANAPGLVTPILTSTCAYSAQFAELSGTPGVAVNGSGHGPADVFGYYFFNNRRGQTTQEFRISTVDPSWKLQFVVGAFIEHENNHVNVGSSWNEQDIALQTRGYNEAFFSGGATGVPVLQVPGAPMNDVSTRNIIIKEDEQSAFGELNYNVTDKLKLTAGVRITNYTQDFSQQYGGNVTGSPSGFYGMLPNGEKPTVSATGQLIAPTTGILTDPSYTGAFPTNYGACPQHLSQVQTTAQQLSFAAAGCPYQYTTIKLTEHPVTPKVGASYQLTRNDLIYATYAEGERPGGINPPAPPIMCAQDFANLGITSSPAVYQHDTVKSTEVGGKFRLFNGQAQVNAAAFHIEWDNVQLVESLPLCAFSYVANAATAASDGAELQMTARTHGFTINSNISYDNARYTQQALGPARSDGKARSTLVNAGDNLGVPDWTANLGVQYDTRVMEFPVYGRIDYIYTGKYMRATSKGTASFNAAVTPNTINGDATSTINARVGFYYKDLEIAGYVKNMLNAQTWINKNEGFSTYAYTGNKQTPRLIGVQMNYRF